MSYAVDFVAGAPMDQAPAEQPQVRTLQDLDQARQLARSAPRKADKRYGFGGLSSRRGEYHVSGAVDVGGRRPL